MLKLSIAKKTGILLSNLVGERNVSLSYNFSTNFPKINRYINKGLTYYK